MIGFVLGNIDGIWLGIVEMADLVSLIGSSERPGNDKLDRSLNVIYWRLN